jgi:hypothetical protein
MSGEKQHTALMCAEPQKKNTLNFSKKQETSHSSFLCSDLQCITVSHFIIQINLYTG